MTSEMPRKYIRNHLPSYETILANPWLAKFGPFLQHPNLWRLNRNSVAGGVAIGLFSGLVPGPLQILTSLILVILLKKNLPVAALVTFYTNPFTIGPLYLLAFQYGQWLVGGDGALSQAPPMDLAHIWNWTLAFLDWMLSLGKPLAVGLVALACTLAALGWLAVQTGWRLQVMWEWRARKQRRRGR